MKVYDSGPLDAKIMLVGEAPGETETRTSKPFTGSSGMLLRQMLQHSGICFDTCFVTNVAPVRPDGNSFRQFYDKKDPSLQLEAWRQELRYKIKNIRPNVVILLGAEALKAVMNLSGIKTWRGNVLTYNNIKIIPTYHPSAVIRQYSLHPIVEMDFAKASKESKFPEIVHGKYDMKISPSLHDVLEWTHQCMKDKPRVAWDIETVGKHVRCISLAKGSPANPNCIVIPFMKFNNTDMAMPGSKNIISIGHHSSTLASYWNKHDEMLVLDALSSILSNEKIPKVGHNSISFDAPLTKGEFNIDINNHYMDTMHAFHLLYAEFPMGLKFISTIMTNYHNYWTNKVTSDDISEWTYCGMDAICTLVISYKLTTELFDSNMTKLYKHINNLAIAITQVQERGITIDLKARDEMVVSQTILLNNVVAEIEKEAGESFNPASPKQVKELLYDKLKFPTMYNKYKKVTTDEEAIKKLLKRYPNENILKNIIKFRKVSKLINTFLTSKLDSDGVMRTSYNPSGTKSGRLSSSKTLWDTGMNLQNIPVGKAKGVENIRNIFIPRTCNICKGKGCELCSNLGRKVFVHADLSQAEALVVARILQRFGDNTLVQLYKDKDFDVHKWRASRIFNKREKDVTKHERDIAKIENHSGNYGAGPGVLVKLAVKEEINGLTYDLAKKIIAGRHRDLPGLRKWWKWVENQVRSTRTLTTCFGRKRIFFGRMDDTTFRDAYSFEPQSIVGDITNRILTKIELNPYSKMDLLLQVHDEIDGECYEKYLPDVVKEIMEASMIPVIVSDTPLIIPIDIEVGSNWRDTVSYDNYVTA